MPPVTMPEPRPTDAIPGEPLLHVPPPGVLLSVVVEPLHTFSEPPGTVGSVLIVSVAVVKQPPEPKV